MSTAEVLKIKPPDQVNGVGLFISDDSGSSVSHQADDGIVLHLSDDSNSRASVSQAKIDVDAHLAVDCNSRASVSLAKTDEDSPLHLSDDSNSRPSTSFVKAKGAPVLDLTNDSNSGASLVETARSTDDNLLIFDDSNSGPSASNKDDDEIVDDGVITVEMLREEEKIRKELSQEEQDLQKEMKVEDKEQTFKRLLNLLSRSQLYAKYLKDKMVEQREKSEKQLGKTKHKENLKASPLRLKGSEGSKSDGRGTKRSRLKSPGTDSRSQKRKKLEAMAMNDETQSELMEDAPEDATQRTLGDLEISPRQPPLLVGGVMREYQLEGFEWLKVLYENGINGILADEMGLGKTIQCIGLLCHLVEKEMPGPYLIVAPLSTLPNWLAEFTRFAPQVPVFLYHGVKTVRDELRRKFSKVIRKGSVATKPIVLTSYDMAIRDANGLRKFFWRYVIVDEGHRLKNFNSRLFIELKRYQAANRLLLTGTPLQNNLSELWSLLNFLLPEIFDNLTVFESWFDVTAMTAGVSDETIIAQEQEKRIISTLHEILNPFLLRRTKADVNIQLPPKKELMVYAPLTPHQETFYKATLNRSIVSLLTSRGKASYGYFDNKILESRKRSCTKVMDYSVFEREMTKTELNILDNMTDQEIMEEDQAAVPEPEVKIAKAVVHLNMRNLMMPLRKICNHPYLIEYPLDPATGEYKVDDHLVRVCGKLQVLDCMLPALQDKGHKVLLFSQMTSLLNILEDYCEMREYNYVRLDGQTSLPDREIRIREFNTDPEVFLFLISTRAGGLGINLTAADTVIIYDSDWNPQCDLQAQDRCHRFGQTKPVVVYRLVTANTIDERIVVRAAAKRRLEKMIMKKGRFSKALTDVDQTAKNPFSVDELKALLKSTDVAGVVKTDNEQLFSSQQLERLLDRSDLMGGDRPQEEPGLFKILDSDRADTDITHDNVQL